MKFVFITLLAVSCIARSQAQDLWLLPESFSYSVGQQVALRFQAGEDFTGTRQNIRPEKPMFLQAASNNYRFNLFPLSGSFISDAVRLDTVIYPGNYVVAYADNATYQETAAASFNAFLERENLTEAIRIRQAYGHDTSIGREYYQHCAKTLIRIKSRMGKSDYLKSSFYTAGTGLLLDIIPIDNPYNLKGAGTITFNVYFMNKLLQNGQLWLWQRHDGKTTKTSIHIENGIATVPVTPEGTWMISLVKMVQDPVKGRGYWQSYRGSLTWGYAP